MTNTTTISVLVPVRNGESHIAETLERFYHTPGVEIVVSDNHSLDGTLEAVRRFKNIRIVRPEKSLSMVENWNFVTSYASADFYKLVSHDDLVHPDSFFSQIKALEANPQAVFAYSKRDFLFETSRRKLKLGSRAQKSEKIIFDTLALLKMVCRTGTNPIGETLCVTFRKSKMPIIDSWKDVEMIYELETYARALRIGPAMYVPEKAGSFRIHTKSYSASIKNYFLLAKNVRNWVSVQPEYPQLNTFDLINLEIQSRFIALKKQILFSILKKL
jgi:glycosyltransferase involved in cell wall biosynthesis